MSIVAWTQGARRRGTFAGSIGVALVSLATMLPATIGHAGAPAVLRAGFEDSTLAANDDGSTASVPLGFTINLFGLNYSNGFVNNNGNMTFDFAQSTFTPFSLTATTRVIIAPFFADVDTRVGNPTRYGPGTVDGHPAFGATWRNVGYFSQQVDKLNRFQVVIINRSDTGAGNFDLEFNYEQIQWETGSASGGSGGFGGSSARAGYSKGTGDAGTFFEFAGSGVPGSFLDSNPAGLRNASRDSGVLGRYLFAVRNGAVGGVDTDGDAIPDAWETDGADIDGDGDSDVDLPAMGADPQHKDIFVEVDWMNRAPVCIWLFCWGGRGFEPIQTALADVRASFANADVTNPDGQPGIDIHIDSGSTAVMNDDTLATWGGMSGANVVPYDASFGSFLGNGGYDWTEFQAVKNANFAAVRGPIFHYAIYADRYGGSNSSGISRGIGAADFIVSDGPWANGFSRTQERGTFQHELGHNLGLRHGGGDNNNYEPNFLSIMNYAFQLGGLLPTSGLDYSRAALAPLNENALSEGAGLDPDGAIGGRGTAWYCPNGTKRTDNVPSFSVDWNCNNAINGGTVAVNLNKAAPAVLTGWDDWANAVYSGGQIGGATGADAGVTPDIEITVPEAIAAHVAAAPGDGTVEVAGPSVLLPDSGIRSVFVDVENLSEISASFTATLTTTLPLTDPSIDTTVPARTTKRLAFPLDTTGIVPALVGVHADLFRAGSPIVRAQDDVMIEVADLSGLSDEQIASYRDQLAEVSDPLLDPALQEALVQMADANLGAPISRVTRPGSASLFLLDTPTLVTWSATDDDGIATYDVRRKFASPSAGFGAYAVILPATTQTSQTSTLAPGTYCWRARATDTVGTVGGYSRARCSGIPIPIERGTRAGGWSVLDVDGAYRDTVLRTSNDGATVEFPGIRYKRLALIASRAPGNGKVKVFVAGRLEAIISLAGASAQRRVFPIDLRSSVSGPSRVRIEVITAGKPVQLQGLGVSRT